MADSKYDAKAFIVDELLAPASALFKVPPFQRRYAWKVAQVAELMNDLYDGEDWMDADAVGESYFLGSIVLAKDPSGPNLVLDGQQRLTTISLLIAVLRQRLMDEDQSTAGQLTKYLETGRIGRPAQAKIALQPEDAKDFGILLKNPLEAEERSLRKKPLGESMSKIASFVEDFISKAIGRGLTRKEALEAMSMRLLYGVEFVRIVAPSEREAFRLFETLNDRGLALNAADLIKNKLFSHAGNMLEDAKTLWQEATQFVGPTEVVNFLRYYWIATKDDVRKDRLFDVYHSYLTELNRPARVLEFVRELRRGAESFRHIADPKVESCPWGPNAEEGLARLNVFRARASRAVLLACALYRPADMEFLIRVCETIIMRYVIVGRSNPNAIEKAFSALCRAIRSSRQEQTLASLVAATITIVPNDETFAREFAALTIDSVSSTWREVLVKLNNQIATGETTVRGTQHVQVEHVLPQNPQQEALAEAGLTGEEAEDLAGRIGNLTLVRGKMNRQMSNAPFSRKKPILAVSEIRLNAAFEHEQIWSSIQIETRSKELAQFALSAWPWPVE